MTNSYNYRDSPQYTNNPRTINNQLHMYINKQHYRNKKNKSKTIQSISMAIQYMASENTTNISYTKGAVHVGTGYIN